MHAGLIACSMHYVTRHLMTHLIAEWHIMLERLTEISPLITHDNTLVTKTQDTSWIHGKEWCNNLLVHVVHVGMRDACMMSYIKLL